MGNLLDQAKEYAAAGLSIIPIDHRTKKPLGSWKEYQSRQADDRELESWFRSVRVKALAAVCGEVSGRLCVLDFDVSGFHELWREEAGELADGLPVQQTGGGGYQVFFRCPDPGKNVQLAWAPNEAEPSGREVAIETRAEGGYVLVPPSKHPSGATYRWISGGPESIPMISQARADALFAAARKLDAAPYTRQELEAQEKRAREAKPRPRPGLNGQGSVIDAFNKRHSIEEMLERYGYTRKGSRYIRPGGKNPLAVIIGGKSFHHSSDDPLKNGHLVDPFDVYCCFEHSGSLTDAVKAAAGDLGVKQHGRRKTGKGNSGEPSPLPSSTGKAPHENTESADERIFWAIKMIGKREPRPELEIQHDRLRKALCGYGFSKYFPAGQQESIFLRLGEHVAERVSPEIVRDSVLRFVEGLPYELPGCGEHFIHRDQLLEILVRGAHIYFAPSVLQCIPPVEPAFVKDTRDKSMFFFQNGFVEVTRDGNCFLPYSDLNGVVWKDQQIKREYHPSDMRDGVFSRFVYLVCGQDERRFLALRTAIGYLLFRYKDPSAARAVVLVDELVSEEANGRSGKSLLAGALGKMRNVLTIDGRMVNVQNQFSFQALELDTDVVVLDDIPKRFPFEQLFHVITGDLEFERKGKQRIILPFADAPKFLITTNFTIPDTGRSAEDRRVEYEFHPYFSPEHTPRDEFGHVLFEQWDDAEWDRFHDFMLECVTLYFTHGLIEPRAVNLNLRKLLQVTSKEFVEWMDRRNQDGELLGRWLIKSALFNDFCREYEDYSKQHERGKFAQHTFSKWLSAYAKYCGLTSDDKYSWDNGRSERAVWFEKSSHSPTFSHSEK